MIATGRHDLAVLLIVATTGNVLGSAVDWAIGRFLVAHRDAKWFPIVGDPLTLVAGILRAPFGRFVAIVTLAKGVRYLFVAGAVLGFVSI